MARDYVTIRERQVERQTVWTETSVGRALLKSAPARVTRTEGQYRIVGVAWGAPIRQVEVQIDSGPWMPATIDQSNDAEFAWKLWSLAWVNPVAGEHLITSRATDTDGCDRRQADLLGEQRTGQSPHPQRLTTWRGDRSCDRALRRQQFAAAKTAAPSPTAALHLAPELLREGEASGGNVIVTSVYMLGHTVA